MSDAPRHHARYSSNAFEEEEPDEPFPLCHGRWPNPILDLLKAEPTALLLRFLGRVAVPHGSIRTKAE